MMTRSSLTSLTGLLAFFLLAAPGCAAETTEPADADAAGTTESAQSSTRPAPPPPAAAAAPMARIGSHGMVLAGSPSAAFLSHIPMFGAPHDVQLVVSGSFTSLDGSAAPASLPASFSDSSFTFLPDRMSLDALRLGALTELKGTIFMGNFEQGGRPLPSRVRFAVSKVLHQHILDEQAPAATELTYFLFGSRTTTFAAHRIGGSPSFDEILRVEVQGENAPSDADLAAGVEAKITGSADVQTKRVGSLTTAKPAKVGTKTFTLKSAKELSCLEGPDFTNACE